jgi:hypothetical protein
MRQEIILRHAFIEFIPEHLNQGTIYVSIRFATASHLCCCGCRNKVVTPLRPTDWKLIFDGKTISFEPSIGNWSFTCQSHYWIKNNGVQWADQWSKEAIDAGRARDRRSKERYFAGNNLSEPAQKAEALPRQKRILARAEEIPLAVITYPILSATLWRQSSLTRALVSYYLRGLI